MAISTKQRPVVFFARAEVRRRELLVVGAVALIPIVLLASRHYRHFGAVPDLVRAVAASLALFFACGYALARLLLPVEWGPLRTLMSLPIGAAVSGLALTALGLAHVPLDVSLWLVLAAGIAAAAVALRRDGAVRPGVRGQLWPWVALLLLLLVIALIPAWRAGAATVYGENPDAHQVVGIAVLFQHAPPTATDVALPVDAVPPAWRFRYPIFYPLAAASNLSHLDPISAFPAMAAILVVLAALGFGAMASRCLEAGTPGGMLVTAAVGLSPIPLYLVWHPYWNQLWGLMLLPYAVLFGWRAVAQRDLRAALLSALMVVTLWLAYPLALPYPLLLIAALAVAYWQRPRVPSWSRSKALVGGALAVVLLLPAVVGAAVKLEQGLSQLLSPNSVLWGGDVTRLMPIGRFVGTGGGIIPAVLVLAMAGIGLWVLPRRPRLALGLALAVLCLIDLRFRLTSAGAYMDFKHLSFVGAFVVMLAGVGVSRLMFGRFAAWIVAAGLLLAGVWGLAALRQDHRFAIGTVPQVTPEMLQLRSWAHLLPPAASVRVDIPPSGTQLWAIYMLGSHPVDSPTPTLHTTYAFAHYGVRADYSLGLRYANGGGTLGPPAATPRYATNPPVFENGQFVLRKIAWPGRLASYPKTASPALIEP